MARPGGFSRRTRWSAIVGCSALVLTASSVIDARAATPPPAEPTVGPLIAGSASYVDGTYVWTDYAYDDRGPDTAGAPGGDAAYPEGMDPNNVADLIQLQLGLADEGRLEVTAVLETLTDGPRESRPLLGLALDSDGDPSSGAGSLPGSWTTSGLGVDRLLLLGRDGGRELVWADGWREGDTFDVEIDAADNTLRATVPFDAPASGALRAVAAVGYDDGQGGSWVNGASPVHDLAFVVDDLPVVPPLQAVTDAVSGFASGGGERQWQEDTQSAILAGKADPAAAVASIELGAMQAGATRLAGVTEKGFHTFLYRSELDLGEGVTQAETDHQASTFYAGPYQPYVVWVPGAEAGAAAPYAGLPFVLYLHGSSQTHTSAVNLEPYVEGGPFSDLNAVVAWPLGRGPQSWYFGPAVVDPLEVADDVLSRLQLDAERVMLAGLSMGGYGTFKLAELFPDRWSLAYVDVAGDHTGMPENLTALPVRIQNGVVDPLIPIVELTDGRTLPPLGTRAQLDGAGTVDYRSYLVNKETHQPAVELAKCIYLHALGTPRVKNPPRVRYTTDPSRFADDPKTGLELGVDGAYWVSGMVPAADAKASVDLTTHALGVLAEAGARFSAAHQNLTEGRDFCGPNEQVRTQDTWTEEGRIVALREADPQRRLDGTLTGLSAVTIAADRTGLGGPGKAVLGLSVIGPSDVELTLTGLKPGTAVTAAGRTRRANGSGTASTTLPSGGSAPVIVTIG